MTDDSRLPSSKNVSPLADRMRFVATHLARPGALAEEIVMSVTVEEAITEVRELTQNDGAMQRRLTEVLNYVERLRAALESLYGVAQDIHSRLSNLTSVAETQRFMPAILAAHELLSDDSPPAPETSPDEYRVSRRVMNCIYNALQDYGNEATYWPPRTGGVLEGCPRGESPTPAQLAVNARSVVSLIDREVLGRSAQETSAPHTVEDDYAHWLSYSGKGKGATSEQLREWREAYYAGADEPLPEKASVQPAVITCANLRVVKAGDKCAHCGNVWMTALDGNGIWHNCHTGLPSNGKEYSGKP